MGKVSSIHNYEPLYIILYFIFAAYIHELVCEVQWNGNDECPHSLKEQDWTIYVYKPQQANQSESLASPL
jgi:hypothetical protein